MYSTDNGAEKFRWPDGGTSPFRGEKNTNWEGGYRCSFTSGMVVIGHSQGGLLTKMTVVNSGTRFWDASQ